jgi:small subunit ribosomal protein S3Ae
MAVKKHWYEIVAPESFGGKVIGETPAADPRQLVGRKIETGLMNISRDYAKFYIKLILVINRVEGSKAYTSFVGHDVMRERVYRMVQRRTRRVDVIQTVKTKDGRILNVKSVFVLIRRTNSAIKISARTLAKELVENLAKENTFENFISMIIKGDLQQLVRKKCSKVYPVGNVEIRKTELVQ